jgi:hypothetical protein
MDDVNPRLYHPVDEGRISYEPRLNQDDLVDRDYNRDTTRYLRPHLADGIEKIDHAGKGPKGWRRPDERIRDDVCERLARDPRIDAREIEVKVNDGLVTLSGSVESRKAKRMAECEIEELPGVRDVRNELKIDPGLPLT